MGLLGQMLGASPYKDWNEDEWIRVQGTATQTGIAITPRIALEVSVVFACVKVLSETLATLPLIVYERTGENTKKRAPYESTYRLLHDRPNSWMTPYDFKEVLTSWAAVHGNGYARKVIDPLTGETTALIPIHPALVTLQLVSPGRSAPRNYDASLLTSRHDDGSGIHLRYVVRQADGTDKTYTQDEILHVRGLSLDGIGGVAVSQHARESIALARAMEAFGSRYFANDATIGVFLEHPGRLTKEAHERLKSDFMAAHSGVGNAFKPKILEENMKVSRLQASAREAQLTDARLHQCIEICRFFRMPPHKVQHMIQATFSNIEHQAIEFVVDTIQPWAVRWEQAITRDLILDDVKHFAEFKFDALLRGDSVARAAYMTARFNMASITPNEIRAADGDNPVDGGDRRYINTASLPLDEEGCPVQPKAAAPYGPPDAEDEESAGDQPDEDAAESEEASVSAPVALAFDPSAAWLLDAAERIVAVEVREVERMASHPSAREAPAFRAHVTAWYNEKQAAYATRTLRPLRAGKTEIDPLVAEIVSGGIEWAARRGTEAERLAAICSVLKVDPNTAAFAVAA